MPAHAAEFVYLARVTGLADDGGIFCESTSVGGEMPAGMSVGDGFPDQFGDIDDKIGSGLVWIAGCADLPHADTDNIVEPPVGLAVG